MSARPDEPRPSHLERRITLGVLLGALVYALIAAASDWRALVGVIATFPAGVYAGALGLTLVNYTFRFAKWHYFTRCLDLEVPVGTSANVFVAGMVMSVTPGKVGEVLKSVLLRRARGIAVATTAPIVVAERLTDLFGLFAIAGFGIAVFDFGRIAFAATLGTVVLTILVLQRPAIVDRILDVVEKLPLVGQLRDRLDEAYLSMRALLRWRVLGLSTLLSVVSWSMEALAFYWILTTLGAAHATVQLAFFVFAMTTILGAVSFVPGGLGVAEGSMIGVLMLFHVFPHESQAAAATYLIRFATLWFGVLLGFVALLRFRRRLGDAS